MRILTPDYLTQFVANLAKNREVRLPVLLPDGTRVIGSPGDGTPALLGGPVLSKPTAAFFPQPYFKFVG